MHTTGEHVQHDDVKEDIDRLKISSECRKRAAEDDSHTLRQIFDEVRDRRFMSILQKERLSTKREMSHVIQYRSLVTELTTFGPSELVKQNFGH